MHRISLDSYNKQIFRNICISNLQLIRLIPLKPIPCNNGDIANEAVLIEFRELPHIEFIIRNAIHKLGDLFSYTIVCGNLNYDMIVYICGMICGSISHNINIIKLNVGNLTNEEYNKLLYTKDFWNLLKGNKILIYQEDSIIFKKNIQDFLKYDYIGAPWKRNEHTLDNLSFGNGGFSLRSRELMLDVLSIKDEVFSYYEKTNAKITENYPPEDLFFSLGALLLKNNNLPDPQTASEFSSENIVNLDSFAGHRFWNCHPDWMNRMILLINDIGNELNLNNDDNNKDIDNIKQNNE